MRYEVREIKKQFEEIRIRYKKDIPNMILRVVVGVADGASCWPYIRSNVLR
ncbi:MAG: hypothetical protein WA323_15385 [Candidatus Nitrosopolaris sp.]|jgi:hypothetical protein